MTRRFRFVLVAVATVTAIDLGALPMRMNALASLGIWAASVAVAVVLAGAVDSALERHEHRTMYSRVLSEARRALNERSMP